MRVFYCFIIQCIGFVVNHCMYSCYVHALDVIVCPFLYGIILHFLFKKKKIIRYCYS